MQGSWERLSPSEQVTGVQLTMSLGATDDDKALAVQLTVLVQNGADSCRTGSLLPASGAGSYRCQFVPSFAMVLEALR